jgi:hypothetical protein
VPGLVALNVKLAPWASVPESNEPPDWAGTVCAAESSLVHVTFSPTPAVIYSAGLQPRTVGNAQRPVARGFRRRVT